MADEIDLAQERAEIYTQDRIRSAMKPLLPGEPGECEMCGEWSGRLIGGACAPCRERYRLP
jgi:hypothetical protein